MSDIKTIEADVARLLTELKGIDPDAEYETYRSRFGELLSAERALRLARERDVEALLDAHNFHEGAGGATECTCGWPNRVGDVASEHEVVHIWRAHLDIRTAERQEAAKPEDDLVRRLVTAAEVVVLDAAEQATGPEPDPNLAELAHCLQAVKDAERNNR